MSFFDKVYQLDSFQRELKILVKHSVKKVFKNLEIETENLFSEVIDWNHLLPCASILAHSDDGRHQDAALRVAQCCITDQNSRQEQRLAASVVLHKLTNALAINLAVDKELLSKDFALKIALPFRLEQVRRNIEQTVYSPQGKEIFLNKFQKAFYQGISEANYISVSAPTSSGKSYILNFFVAEQFSKGQVNIIYLVPTRALINQAERDFREAALADNLDVYISSVPQLPETTNNRHQSLLFIFTQERLHWFLNENKSFKTDYLIIDEAQKIGEGSRGILLQQKIEDLVSHSPEVKILFCSASTENPGILLEGLPSNLSKKTIVADYVAVNQNLIWVSQTHKKPRELDVRLCYGTENIPLGKIHINKDISLSEGSKLPLFAYLLGSSEGGNMIYVNTQDDAEKAASILYDLLPLDNNNEDLEILELIDLCKTIVHPGYDLGRVLKRGIAFHYGNMPLILKSEIERLFSSGKIKYLICTSTLLEGVNLPAKSIFLKRPGRGKANPLSQNDFWNLAGRAGRSKVEFQGNIICIDPEDWDPPRERKRYNITRAITEVSKDTIGLLDYIKHNTPLNEHKDDYEYALTYYYTRFLKNKSLKNLQLDHDFEKALEAEFSRIPNEVEIPEDILYRNLGISPFSQQRLLEYFKEYPQDIRKLIPVYPDESSESSNPAEFYRRIMLIINNTISPDSSYPGLCHYRAILLVNWMRGFPLARIISSNYEYYKDKKTLAAVIRSTMTDIEEYIRFRFAKYSSCYIDILKFYLEKEHPDLAKDVPELNTWIEFGVSRKTHVSLITLGLSRHSAIELTKFIQDGNLTLEECIKWLQEKDVSSLDVSNSIKNEISLIKKVIDKNSTSSL